MNIALKIALLEKGMSQFHLSRLLGIDPGKLSRIVNGWLDPSEQTKKEIARYLGKPVVELFRKAGTEGSYADPR